MVTLFDGVLGFAVNLGVGGLALYVAAAYEFYDESTGYGGLEHAVVTALVAAVVGALLSLVPIVGPVLALGGWIGVIYWRYPGGWVEAVTMGVLAWIAALVVLAFLAAVGVGSFSALGVPGL